MESRKLGNKIKMIKLMSKVGKYGLIILIEGVFECISGINFGTASKKGVRIHY